MDGVGTPIIGRPRPLPGHDTPNPAYHPHTLNYEEPVKPEDEVQGDKRLDLEAGMATAEYAIGTVAAAAFAGLLLAIIRSGGLRPMIESLLSSALSVS